ncbi:MAG: FAD binding domain-containing protein [Dehalococcoidales bacterium]|nr:FAD binding domain-containing protein [Dehalococcoidales bacterium]
MKRFKHINAKTTEQAVAVLEEYGEKASLIAGGTDLLGQMKDCVLPDYPEVIINLKSIQGLDYIKEERDILKIGALTRLEDIAGNEIVNKKYPALAEAARKTASPHIREQGTIAGNISQSNRCWYYWVPDNRFNCIRKGGKRCYAFGGEGRYHSIYGSTRIQDTPCTTGCPAGVNIPEYMSKLREGDIPGAAAVLMDANPFPAITGRVCPHTCENGCNRIELDEAVAIRNVERYLGNYILDNFNDIYSGPGNMATGNIAVIGSGPSGLSCAWYLRNAGYQVTVFETMDQAGGMLRYGIPEYRLSNSIVQKQIDVLESVGIEFRIGPEEGKISDIQELSGNYDAVFIATGAWKDRPLGIEGEELMMSGTEFLRNPAIIGDPYGKKVAVMGGGNVAIDVSRTLLRLGAEPVIIYRRGKDEMPALEEELLKAEEEGIEMQFLTLPVGAYGAGSKVNLKCVKMKLGEPDESGRPTPEPIVGSEYTVEYDAAIKATGEIADLSIIPEPLIEASGTIHISETGLVDGNIFAGGDFVNGPSTVVEAIASGRKAAETIDTYLDGKGIRKKAEPRGAEPFRFDKEYLRRAPRNELPELPVEERIKNPEGEDAGNLKAELAMNEAGRCFNCGCLAVNSSDIAPALIALDAVIHTTKREIKAEDFFTVNFNNTTVLDGEIITEIEIPVSAQGVKSKFIKFALRKSIDFPVVNCAVAIGFDEGKVSSARICLNAVYNIPYRAIAAEEAVKGQVVTEEVAEAAGNAAVADVCPLPDNTYKIQIARTLVKRAILACVNA